MKNGIYVVLLYYLIYSCVYNYNIVINRTVRDPGYTKDKVDVIHDYENVVWWGYVYDWYP